MGAARGRNYLTVEVKPSSPSSAKVNLAPSTPSPSPKAVRFATCEKSESRPLSRIELWSLYNFEDHARQCVKCFNPADVLSSGKRLCSEGRSRARDIAEHIYQQDHVVYSTTKDNHKHVRVNTPAEYDQVRQLLNATDRSSRRPSMAPIVSYDTLEHSPRRTHKKYPESDSDRGHTAVIVEPASSTSRRSKHKSSHYKKELVEESLAQHTVPSPTHRTVSPSLLPGRRGSLYEKDMQSRRQESYRVEIRKPSYVTSKDKARRKDSEYHELYHS